MSDLQIDAATRQVTANYVAAFVANDGPVQSDYAQLGACSDYGSCRTAAQQALSDLQAFQAQRSAAIVPANLKNSDAMLGDGLSAAIAAMQELISGMDKNDENKVKDGANKLDDAMLSIGKAEAALGAGLK